MVLRVKLEIVPFGDEEKVREIGRLDIYNKGYLDPFCKSCEYGVIEVTQNSGAHHNKSVQHRRDLGAWQLVKKVLHELEVYGP